MRMPPSGKAAVAPRLFRNILRRQRYEPAGRLLVQLSLGVCPLRRRSRALAWYHRLRISLWMVNAAIHRKSGAGGEATLQSSQSGYSTQDPWSPQRLCPSSLQSWRRDWLCLYWYVRTLLMLLWDN